jgi:hypothetical protein
MLMLRHSSGGLLGACNLRGATGAPATEGAARSCDSTAGGELRLAPALGARAGRSAIRPRPESATFPAPGCGEGVRVAASAAKSRLGPNRDAQNTIDARRRAESVDNNCDNCSRHHDDRGCGRCHDSDDAHEHNWSPNQ